MISRFVAVALVLLASLTVGVNSASSLTPPFAVSAAKKAAGPYTDVTQEVTIKQGKTKLLYWKVSDANGAADQLSFVSNINGGSAESYKITWYRGKKPKASRKITQEVVGEGYPFRIPANKSKAFVAKVKAKQTETLCLAGAAFDSMTSESDQAQFFINGTCT